MHISSSKAPFLVSMSLVLSLCGAARGGSAAGVPGGAPPRPGGSPVIVISPVVGVARNEVDVRGAGGSTTRRSDTSAQYGLFGLLLYRQIVITDYVFYTEVNDSDVFGNLLFVNGYLDRYAPLTWNAGVGYLYHRIGTPAGTVTVHVPMIKTGPWVNLWRGALSLHPYAGYSWEYVDSVRGSRTDDAILLGLTMRGRWRKTSATLNYYYQLGLGDADDHHTARFRLQHDFTRNWGAIARLDYMEHATSDDQSIMVGPVYTF